MRSYVSWIIRHRKTVIALTLAATIALALQIRHLHIVLDPSDMLPQEHPYVKNTNEIEKTFGLNYLVVIGITAKKGHALTPRILEKVQRITAALRKTRGVIRGNVFSLAAPRAKAVEGGPEGIDVEPLMGRVPETRKAVARLEEELKQNPVYYNWLISRNERTLAVLAEFQTDVSGFRGILSRVKPIVDRERDQSVDIALGGVPVFLAAVEGYSSRMALLFPLAILITGLIHYEAFRTVQGLVLPLVTALLAVVWALGAMGLAHVPMDAFNATTPILILAVAAGHAVQILKRYYEEYHRLRRLSSRSADEINRLAVVESLARIGPVMLTAGTIAFLAFFSLVVFQITTIRTFGIFTAFGIFSGLCLEMTFIPALRSVLPAPGEREQRREHEHRLWDRLVEGAAALVTERRRRPIYGVIVVLLVLSAVGASRVVTNTSYKSYFFPSVPQVRNDRALNRRLGGTNTLYLEVSGKKGDVITEPKVLHAIDDSEGFLEAQPYVGKILSIADFIKRLNEAMHGDDPAYFRIPDRQNLIAQYPLLYSMASGADGLATYVDHSYRSANVLVLLKTDSTVYIEQLIPKLKKFTTNRFGPDVDLKIGGSLPQAAAFSDVIVREKILSVLQISAVVLILASLVFRSLLAGVLVLAPLALAVVVKFGIMGFTGISLNIATAIISALAVGIGTDYAIYMIYRVREELSQGTNAEAAFRTAVVTAGKAILFVACAIAGGYGVLLFSYGFYVHIWMAILIATSMLVSSVAAITILPVLLFDLRPQFLLGKKAAGEGESEATRDSGETAGQQP